MYDVYVIAEIGQAHDGSLGILHSYIDAISESGVNAIKFQTHIAEAESSKYEPFRVNFSYQDLTRIDYWKRMEFTKEQWIGIRDHCKKVGLDFISSPFSCAAVDLLESINVEKYKIGSGEVNNFLMLEKIAKTGKDIILSSGMSNLSEIDDTISFLKEYNNKLYLMQCTTKYPTSPEDLGLNIINEFKERYKLPIGLSDHSGDIFASLAAVTLGAEIIEVHTVFDKRMFGPDTSSSLTIEQLKKLVEGIEFIKRGLNTKIDKSDNSEFSKLKSIFEKSLAVNKNISKNKMININDLEAKKPFGYGIPANEYKNILGKKINKNKKKYEFLSYEDFI